MFWIRVKKEKKKTNCYNIQLLLPLSVKAYSLHLLHHRHHTHNKKQNFRGEK